MRIGIDLDGTICNTAEIVNQLAEEYAKNKEIDSSLVFNDREVRDNFFSLYINNIFTNVLIKDNVSEVLNRLKNKGHEIYVITARSNNFTSKYIDVLEPTNNWLNKHNIVVDKIIINSYGPTKASACLENNIELMIDDDLYNCQVIREVGINCLLFDDKNVYNESNRVTSWIEVENYIEGK